ncbi:MAG: D-alanyl-D-alanine carboxypeptidase family protein [Dehalococcoidia bacterium]
MLLSRWRHPSAHGKQTSGFAKGRYPELNYLRGRRSRHRWLFPLVVIFMLLAFMAVQELRSVPPLIATASVPVAAVPSQPAPALPWPSGGGAALAVKGLGIVGSHGEAVPRPIASVTKIMTAFILLQDHPVTAAEPGPRVTITPQNVALYRSQAAEGQSVVRVVTGEQLSEYQLLQGLLLPSSNNFAALLAEWDTGSVEAFVTKMNAEAATLGMSHTHYADASGNSPQSMSVPEDLIVLAEAAMANPTFADLVSQSQATLPVAGVIHNVDTILGENGIIGIKTGWTDEAGGCFVFAAKQRVDGIDAEIVGAVIGQPDLDAAFATAKSLIAGAQQNLHMVQFPPPDQPVASYQPPWGSSVRVVAAQSAGLLTWPGMPIQTAIFLPPLRSPAPAGTADGWLTVQTGEQQSRLPLQTAGPLHRPTFLWRLTRR